jgi:hypothetical protein
MTEEHQLLFFGTKKLSRSSIMKVQASSKWITANFLLPFNSGFSRYLSKRIAKRYWRSSWVDLPKHLTWSLQMRFRLNSRRLRESLSQFASISWQIRRYAGRSWILDRVQAYNHWLKRFHVLDQVRSMLFSCFQMQ